MKKNFFLFLLLGLQVQADTLQEIRYVKNFDNEYLLQLQFDILPAYELRTQGKNSYRLILKGFLPASEKVLLPYYAPKNFVGIEYIKAIKGKEPLSFIIGSTPDYSLQAWPERQSIFIRGTISAHQKASETPSPEY